MWGRARAKKVAPREEKREQAPALRMELSTEVSIAEDSGESRKTLPTSQTSTAGKSRAKARPLHKKGEAKNGVGLAVEEFFEEEAGEAAGVVAEDAVFLEEIVKNCAKAKVLEFREIDDYGFGALLAIAPGNFG